MTWDFGNTLQSAAYVSHKLCTRAIRKESSGLGHLHMIWKWCKQLDSYYVPNEIRKTSVLTKLSVRQPNYPLGVVQIASQR